MLLGELGINERFLGSRVDQSLNLDGGGVKGEGCGYEEADTVSRVNGLSCENMAQSPAVGGT
jgi:hypothetical protein